jgi:hypothetical protein
VMPGHSSQGVCDGSKPARANVPCHSAGLPITVQLTRWPANPKAVHPALPRHSTLDGQIVGDVAVDGEGRSRPVRFDERRRGALHASGVLCQRRGGSLGIGRFWLGLGLATWRGRDALGLLRVVHGNPRRSCRGGNVRQRAGWASGRAAGREEDDAYESRPVCWSGLAFQAAGSREVASRERAEGEHRRAMIARRRFGTNRNDGRRLTLQWWLGWP